MYFFYVYCFELGNWKKVWPLFDSDLVCYYLSGLLYRFAFLFVLMSKNFWLSLYSFAYFFSGYKWPFFSWVLLMSVVILFFYIQVWNCDFVVLIPDLYLVPLGLYVGCHVLKAFTFVFGFYVYCFGLKNWKKAWPLLGSGETGGEDFLACFGRRPRVTKYKPGIRTTKSQFQAWI